MSLAEQDLRRLARLARLEFTEADVPKYQSELNSILEMVDTLQTAQTEGVAPMAHPLDMTQPLRPDAVTEDNQRETLMAAAPEAQAGHFAVPRVIE
nr:Asp-tRNA(Asn)/Glu-tRNA(Gln) amidotransferase subunit GatC [Oceanococcus sp. HetDA_MAG_MS8]